MQTSNKPDETFKIGSVARLTGLSTHTLRKWESRYGAITPIRTERGERCYTRRDLDRLSLIKRLVDSGVAPSDVARLSDAELKRKSAQLTELESTVGFSRASPVRVAVAGEMLAALFERSAVNVSGMEVVSRATAAAELEPAADGLPVDVLVYDSPTVNRGTRELVEALQTRIGAAAAIVVYEFSAKKDLVALQSPRLETLRGPADLSMLEQSIARLLGKTAFPPPSSRTRKPAYNIDDAVPAPRLSRELIVRLAQASPKIRCECPHHLADIILSLRAFEDYSQACESDGTEDAALHHYLWRSTAQARALFEDAIERVAEAEGIPLEE